MVIGIGLLLALAMLLFAMHVTKPRRLRFSIEAWRVALRLEIDNDEPSG